MRAFLAGIFFPIFLTSASSDTTDVFPLQRGIVYDYSLFTEFKTYEMLTLIGISTDSGFVRCIVTDSTRINDTTISWTIRQQRELYHRYVGMTVPYRDTAFRTNDTIFFSLIEYASGWHLMITPIDNQTWGFSEYDSLYRFADSSSVLLTRQWYSPPPSGSTGTDSFWLSDTSGFSRRRSSATLFQGFHGWTAGRSDITLLHNPALSVQQRPTVCSPAYFVLEQNYPNPFNPSTTIRYGLPQRSAVQLVVYNTLGQQIATLVQEETEAGYHEVKFDGSGLSSGVYFYRLTAGSYIQTRKLLLVR